MSTFGSFESKERRCESIRSISSSKLFSIAKDPSEEADHFILPVFPLRKRVKFPTQTLQLTLWEDRYKALSRKVLQSGSGPDTIFGAMYCSHKSQIIKGGINPVTPIVEKGDVGIVCSVLSSQVFIDGNEVEMTRINDNDVQKIRLNAIAVGRFRVVEVLSYGHDTEKFGSDGQRPFIVVKGSRIDDEEIQGIVMDTQIETTSSTLQRLLERIGDIDEPNANAKLASGDFSWAFQEGSNESQKRQLMSFFLTSRLESKASTNEMIHMLEMASTSERLDYIEKNLLPSPRSAFPWFQ